MTADDFTREVNEAVDWDSRKALADVWQEHAPIANLSEATYDALIAVAKWGARSALENAAADAEDAAERTRRVRADNKRAENRTAWDLR